MAGNNIGVMVTWRTRVQDLRAKGMTLAEIGREIGLSIPAVNDIDKGRTKEPKGDTAIKLVALHNARIGRRSAKRASA